MPQDNRDYKTLRLVTHPTGHQLIQPFTPLHVTNLFLLMLKDTFSSVPESINYPFKFSPDYNETGILIDTVYNRESNIHGKPYLVVGRGPVNTQPIVLGDRYMDNYTGTIPPLDDAHKVFHKFQTTQLHSSLTIKVISKHSAEVDILSNEIFSFLTTTRTALTKHAPIQFTSSINLSEISKFEQDDTMFYCVAGMQYTLQYKWVTWMEKNILGFIGLYLTTDKTEAQPPHTRTKHKQTIAEIGDLENIDESSDS